MIEAEREQAIAQKAIADFCKHIDQGTPEENFRWESFTGRFVEMLAECSVFVDCGAEFGFYTYLAVKNAPANCRIHAFEPEPVRYEVLVKFLSPYKNVKVWPYALSDASGYQTIFKPEKGCSATMDEKLAQFDHPPEQSLEVECVTLDDFIKDEPVDIIKLDIEGAEVKALPKMQRILREHHPVIFAEIHPRYIESIQPGGMGVISDILDNHGYTARNHNGVAVDISVGRVILTSSASE